MELSPVVARYSTKQKQIMSDLDELDDDSNEDVETATAAEVLQKLEEVTNKSKLELIEFPLINAFYFSLFPGKGLMTWWTNVLIYWPD